MDYYVGQHVCPVMQISVLYDATYCSALDRYRLEQALYAQGLHALMKRPYRELMVNLYR